MSYADCHIPLSRADLTLREALDRLAAMDARQQQIPLIVRLGGISGCRPLNRVIYDRFIDTPLDKIRRVVSDHTSQTSVQPYS